MADQLRHHGKSPEMEFEQQDLSPKGVYAFLVGLAGAGVLVSLFLWGLYEVLDAREKKHQPAQNPLVQQTEADTRHVLPAEIDKFPQPRLERNERLEIDDFRLQEEQTLSSYGWVGEKAGVVRVPIERAMQLLAQRGLPTTPRAGTTPASTVNVAQQAAERSDTSNLAKGKAKQ